MKKRFMLPIAAVALFGLMAAFATSAQAIPTQTMLCSGCHTLNPSIVVSATPTASNNATASFDIAVTSGYGLEGWAVFDGFTKVAGSAGSTGTAVLPVGKTYTVIGAGGTFVGDGTGIHEYNSMSITATAPVSPIVWRTVSIKASHIKKAPKGVVAMLTSKANGAKYRGRLSIKKGWMWATFRVPVGSYRLTVTARKFKFKPCTVVIH